MSGRPSGTGPTPRRAPELEHVATVGSRVGAYLLDVLVLLPSTVVFAWQLRTHRHGGVHETLIALSLILAGAYEIVAIAVWGQTVGKRIVGVRVARGKSPGIGFLPSATRWAVRGLLPVALIGRFASGVVVRLSANAIGSLWALVLLASMSRNQSHRGIHDRLAGTTVVNADQPTS